MKGTLRKTLKIVWPGVVAEGDKGSREEAP